MCFKKSRLSSRILGLEEWEGRSLLICMNCLPNYLYGSGALSFTLRMISDTFPCILSLEENPLYENGDIRSTKDPIPTFYQYQAWYVLVARYTARCDQYSTLY